MNEPVLADYRPVVARWMKWLFGIFVLLGAWCLITDFDGMAGVPLFLMAVPFGLGSWLQTLEPRLTARAEGFTVDSQAAEVIEWDNLVTVAAAPTTPQTTEFFSGYVEYMQGAKTRRLRFGWQRKNAPDLVRFLGEACFHVGTRLLQDGEARLGTLTYSEKAFVAQVDGVKKEVPPEDILSGEHLLEFLIDGGKVSAWRRAEGKPLVYMGSMLIVDKNANYTRLWEAKLKAPNVLPHLANISRILNVRIAQVPARPSL